MSEAFPIYAHIYNRGIDRRIIFPAQADYSRFMLTLRVVGLGNTNAVSTLLRMREKELLVSLKQEHLLQQYGPSLLQLLAFCLMDNHYHLIVRAATQQAIVLYASRLANSFTRFFNTKYKRKGRLFESKYQMVNIKTDEQLVHVVRYVHTNPANRTKNPLKAQQLKKYLWSSLPAYLEGESKMCEVQQILSFYSSIDDFWEFTKAGIHAQEPVSHKMLFDLQEE